MNGPLADPRLPMFISHFAELITKKLRGLLGDTRAQQFGCNRNSYDSAADWPVWDLLQGELEAWRGPLKRLEVPDFLCVQS